MINQPIIFLYFWPGCSPLCEKLRWWFLIMSFIWTNADEIDNLYNSTTTYINIYIYIQYSFSFRTLNIELFFSSSCFFFSFKEKERKIVGWELKRRELLPEAVTEGLLLPTKTTKAIAEHVTLATATRRGINVWDRCRGRWRKTRRRSHSLLHNPWKNSGWIVTREWKRKND